MIYKNRIDNVIFAIIKKKEVLL
jgi:hypothetical protein